MKKNKLALPHYSFFKKGFTMIEMLVVVTIIAVIVAIGMVSYTNSTRNARNAKRRSDLEVLRQALVLYRSDNSCYPAALSTVVTDGYLSEEPTDPKAAAGFVYTYSTSGAVCSGGGYPSFDIYATPEPGTGPTIAVSNP